MCLRRDNHNDRRSAKTRTLALQGVMTTTWMLMVIIMTMLMVYELQGAITIQIGRLYRVVL
jgi:hypothetical protein